MDEGYDKTIENPVYSGVGVDADEYDSYSIGDEYEYNNETWIIYDKQLVGKMESPHFYFKRIIYTTIHYALMVNYWHVYNYSFMEWHYLREQRRAA